jgi:hypothetical protein
MHVREAELPVLVKFVDPIEEAIPLLFLGEMKKDLHDMGSVAMQVSLKVLDGLVSLVP